MAQCAIIRWIAMPGNDDIDNSGDEVPEEADESGDYNDGLGLDSELDPDDERLKPYKETQAGKEEFIVQQIIQEWLKKKCGIEGGVVSTAISRSVFVFFGSPAS